MDLANFCCWNIIKYMENIRNQLISLKSQPASSPASRWPVRTDEEVVDVAVTQRRRRKRSLESRRNLSLKHTRTSAMGCPAIKTIPKRSTGPITPKSSFHGVHHGIRAPYLLFSVSKRFGLGKLSETFSEPG